MMKHSATELARRLADAHQAFPILTWGGLRGGLCIAMALSLPLVSLAGSPAFALCNKICRAKCTLGWRAEFKSEQDCIKVWSRRNGPTGVGCGAKGGPFQRCE